jgi:hypothetical protein
MVGVGASFFDGIGVRRRGCFRQISEGLPKKSCIFLDFDDRPLGCKILVLVLVDFNTSRVYVKKEASYLRTIKTLVASSRATQES